MIAVLGLLATANAAMASGVTYTFSSAADAVTWPASIPIDGSETVGGLSLYNDTSGPMSINGNFQGIGAAPGFSPGNDALWGTPLIAPPPVSPFGPGLTIIFDSAPNRSVNTASFDFAWIDQSSNAPSTLTVQVMDRNSKSTSKEVTLSSFTSPNGSNGGSTTGQAGTVSLSASSLGLSNIFEITIDSRPINSVFKSEFGIDNLKLNGGSPSTSTTPYTLSDGTDTISWNLNSSSVAIGPSLYGPERTGSTITVDSGVTWTTMGHFHLGYNDGLVGMGIPPATETTDILHLLTGSSVSVKGETIFGSGLNKRAVVNIDTGASFSSHGGLQIGYLAPLNLSTSQCLLTVNGTLTTDDGATVGVIKGGRATVNVDGPSARWSDKVTSASNSGNISFGSQGGQGTLNVTNGGQVQTSYLSVGDGTGAFNGAPGVGLVTVAGNPATGAVSRLDLGDMLNIGRDGAKGNVNVKNDGLINTDRVYLGIGDTSSGTLTVESGGRVNIRSVLNSGSQGTVDVTSGGEVVLGTPAVGPSPTAGTVVVGYNGTLAGSGTIKGNVIGAGGTISPGHSPGTLNITGDVTLSKDTVLMLQIAGTSAGQFDVLNVSGALDLNNAKLDLVFLNGYAPTAGHLVNLTMFQSTSGITGTLGGVDVSGLPSGLGASVNFDSLSSGTITFSTHPVPEPASLAMMLGGGALLLRRRR